MASNTSHPQPIKKLKKEKEKLITTLYKLLFETDERVKLSSNAEKKSHTCFEYKEKKIK
jgi:hypothetical protein